MPLTNDEMAAVEGYLRSCNPPPRIRMVILGAQGVGKEKFQRWLQCGFFNGSYDPTVAGDSHFRMEHKVEGRRLRWEGEMLSLPSSAFNDPQYYMSRYGNLRHVEACVFMYDVGSRASFEDMQRYHEEFMLERSLPRRGTWCTLACKPACPPRPAPYAGQMYVVAHKIDRELDEWEVRTKEGEVFAESIGADFVAMSSKTGEGCSRNRLTEMTLQALLGRTRIIAGEQSPPPCTAMGSRTPKPDARCGWRGLVGMTLRPFLRRTHRVSEEQKPVLSEETMIRGAMKKEEEQFWY